MATTVVLAEDSYLMREGISSLLEMDDSIELLATCENYDELIAAVDRHQPDVVITDIRMPPTPSGRRTRTSELSC